MKQATPAQSKKGLDDPQEFASSLIQPLPESSAAVPEAPASSVPLAMPSDCEIDESQIEMSGRLTEPDKQSPEWQGKLLGRYRLLEMLGQGAMGVVIRALDTKLERMVAVKVLGKRLEGADEQAFVRQFLREARSAAKIDHPNVVSVYEIAQHDGWWYLAMELVEGHTLKQIVDASGPMPIAKAAAIVTDVASALAATHRVGVVHRDVKPSNLMIGRDGRCKLTDFGLVRLHDPNDPFDFTDRAVGTPAFMSPEAAQKMETPKAADIYSLGATLYFALAGRAPFSADSLEEMIQHHLRDAPPPLTAAVPEASKTLNQLVAAMLAKDPTQRPSAERVAAALRAEIIDSGQSSVLTSIDDPAGPQPANAYFNHPEMIVVSKKQLRRSRLIWLILGIATALLLFCALVAAGVLIERWRDNAETETSLAPPPARVAQNDTISTTTAIDPTDAHGV